jgi:TetR/AcrR family transcriptional regulator, cholesterol catabolism regulator
MEIKERITREAMRMFLQFGIKSITMDEIARSLGMSKRTLYECFSDKDELVRHCLEMIQEENLLVRKRIVEGSQTMIEAILAFLNHGISMMKGMNPSFMQDLRKYHFKVWYTIYSSHKEQELDFSRGVIREGIKQGVFRPELNVDIVVKLLHEQFLILNNEEVFPPAQYNIPEVMECMLVIFMRGIASAKGMEIISKSEFEVRT